MAIKLTWLSHASWLIESGDARILLDPFFTDNPAAKSKAEDFEDITHVLVSHGHFDHVADVASIAKRTKATVIAGFEVAQWFGKQGLENTIAMNIGGTTPIAIGEEAFGDAKMVPALHSSELPDGSCGGTPAGFVLTLGGQRVYFACDTAYFGDMKFYAYGVDVAVLPIGDLFTMGIDDSIEVIKLIEPKAVLPTHYNTWPPIEQDAKVWASRVNQETTAKPVVLAVEASYTVGS